MKQRVDVSHEMLAFVGPGPLPQDRRPLSDCLTLAFTLEGAGRGLCIEPVDTQVPGRADLVLMVTRTACGRIFGGAPAAPGRYHLPLALRALALAIRDCAAPGPARETLRLAKSIELLCAVFDHLARDLLIPVEGDSLLTDADARRLAAARRLIDENWQEKLTLETIARACGLNRGKLTRGFRAAYACSVGDALTERRMSGARRLLDSTDLPVASVGYRCGYLNNAAFTRAFSRRFGVAPTRYRASGARAA